jgi:hypothetical protein
MDDACGSEARPCERQAPPSFWYWTSSQGSSSRGRSTEHRTAQKILVRAYLIDAVYHSHTQRRKESKDVPEEVTSSTALDTRRGSAHGSTHPLPNTSSRARLSAIPSQTSLRIFCNCSRVAFSPASRSGESRSSSVLPGPSGPISRVASRTPIFLAFIWFSGPDGPGTLDPADELPAKLALSSAGPLSCDGPGPSWRRPIPYHR